MQNNTQRTHYGDLQRADLSDIERLVSPLIPLRGMLDRMVEDVYGPVRGKVIVGSLAAGYGHPGSDVDVYAVIDDESIPSMPMMTFESGLKFDITFYGLATLRRELKYVTQPDAWLKPMTVVTWRALARGYDDLVRFLTGVIVDADDGVAAFLTDVDRSALVEGLARWWRAESVRRVAAGRLLAKTEAQRFAGQLRVDAILCEMEALMVEAGQPYVKQKWLLTKLAKAGRVDLVELVSKLILDVSASSGKVVDLHEQLAEHEDRLGISHQLSTHLLDLSLATGVEEFRLDGATRLVRWGRRQLLTSSRTAHNLSEGVTIDGSELDTFEPELAALVHRNMAWIGARPIDVARSVGDVDAKSG